MPEIMINDLQGGLSTKSPTALLPNQCAYAQNVEWVQTKCGERRLGSLGIDLTGSGIEDADNIAWVYRHTPTPFYKDAELWVLAVYTAGPTVKLVYKDTSWHTVIPEDDISPFGYDPYKLDAVSFNGKMFLAYPSIDGSLFPIDRLHVWDGTYLRRTGLAPATSAPSTSLVGVGTVDDVRSYRVRFRSVIDQTTLRSEPSPEVTVTPVSNTHVEVTMPTVVDTHTVSWELEAAKSDGIWYRIATQLISSTTYNDTIADGVSYSTISEALSPDIGDYTVIPSVKYLTVDDDRLIMASSLYDSALTSRVIWTPVSGASGVGNDERIELDTDPFKDLNNREGGGITALSDTVNGYIYVFKLEHTYQGVRTTERENAYDFITLTKARGALPGSVVSAVDNNGIPSLFALDPHIGTIRLGGLNGGIETCGTDLVEIWDESTREVAVSWEGTTQTAVYVPEKKQVQFWGPNLAFTIVLHTQHMRLTDDGFRGGYAIWSNDQAVYSACNFSTNIDDDTDRNFTLRPFIGTTTAQGLVSRTDVGNNDNGVGYSANITTRDYVPANFLSTCNIKDVVIYGKAVPGANLVVTIGGIDADVGNISDDDAVVDFTPNVSGREDPTLFYNFGHGIRHLDELTLNEVSTFYISFGDDGFDPTTEQWAIEAIALAYVNSDKRTK